MRAGWSVWMMTLACLMLASCDGRPLLYQIAPSDQDIELLALFQKIDAANTGRLTRVEVDDYFKRRFAELDRNHDGFLDDSEAQGIVPIIGKKTAQQVIFALDMNGDGHLSVDEFLRLSNYLFTRDTNRDGVLTLQEVKTPPTDTYISPESAPGVQVGKPNG